MDFLKKLWSIFTGKTENASSLLSIDVGDKRNHTINNNKSLSDISANNNSGTINISGNDINNGAKSER